MVGVTVREIVLLGSTGSVGRQADDVVRAAPDRFRVVGLAAGGGDVATLARQVRALAPEVVAVADPAAARELRSALAGRAHPQVLTGPDATAEVAGWPCDTVLNAITGSVGLGPTLAALDAGRTVALANKESLIAGGRLVLDRAGGAGARGAGAGKGRLVPVDSEHSALAQCLRAGRAEEVRRLVLTASGGPFRGRTAADLEHVTPAEALAHPTWSMGPVISVNSATLVNKGLEVIEAHLLFGIPYADVEVVVHPQSVVHSMVEFTDGSTVAQASPPDMRLPIAVALGWPDRVPGAARPVDWTTAQSWQFLPLDDGAFPAVALCRAAGEAGGGAPAALNAANEECVAAFLAGRLPFRGIVEVVSEVTAAAPARGNPGSVAEVLDVEDWARSRARELVADRRRG
ncbi:MAG TPA: 1-deoxy-D-xylulose-5-phosphate reductoisomerase [Mycobacteriales bacterium]